MDWAGVPRFWVLGAFVGKGMFLVAPGLVLAALILLVRWLLVQSRPRGQSDGSPAEILKRRYARGEITRGEFESIRRDLLA